MKLNIQLFASGTIFEKSDGNLRAKLTWSSSINEDGKGSTITAKLSVRRVSNSGTTGTFSYNMEIDGETWSGSKKLTSLGTSYKEVASKTKSIDYSGTYSAYLYAKVNGPSGTSLAGLSVNGDGYAPLDATSYPATLNSVNIDNFVSQGKFTPTFTENQSGLYYGMYIIAYTPSQTIVSWNSPIAVSNGVEATLTDAQKQTLWNYLDERENRTAVDIMFVLASYSDSSLSGDYQIGTSDIHFLNTIAIPQYSLNWNTTTITDAHANIEIGGHTLSYYAGGNFVKGLSLPVISFSAYSSTGYLYGKTITYTINGVARTSPYQDTSWNGDATYTLTASDGRTSTTTSITINVVNYFVPYLSNIRVVRPIPTDDVVRVSYTANYYDGTGLSNLTNAVYNFYYRESENDNWTPAGTLSGSGTSGSQTFSNVDIDNLNYKKPFYYKIEFTDRIGNTMAVNPYSASIPKGLPVWNAYTDSNDTNVLNVNGNEEIDGDIHVSGAINQTNPSTRVGSNLVLRGTTTYPEASINLANPDGSHTYIAGYGVGGDLLGIYSGETGNVIATLDKYGNLNINGISGNVAKAQVIYDVSLDYVGDNYPPGFYAVSATDGPLGATWYYVMQNSLGTTDTMWRYQEIVQIWTAPYVKYRRLKASGTWYNWEMVPRKLSFAGNTSVNITLDDGWGFVLITTTYRQGIVHFVGKGNQPQVNMIRGDFNEMTFNWNGSVCTIGGLFNWDHHIVEGSNDVLNITL